MNVQDWLAHPWALRWTESLLHFVWQGTALAVIALLIMQMRSPRRRYAGLVATFGLMTVCPFATLGVLSWTASDGSMQSNYIAVEEIHPFIISSDIGIEEFIPVDPVASTVPTTWKHRISSVSSWRPAVLMLWLSGVAVFLARLIIGIFGLSQLLSGTSRAPVEWSREMSRLIDRTGRRFAVTVRASVRIAEPIAVWWWRPVILLPAAWLTEVPSSVLESVLAHELAHLRRWDLWVNFYQRLGESLLFFHPGVWWVSRQIRIERELCCDAAAVALTGKPLGYAQALEYLVRQRLEQVRPLLAAGMGGTEMTLLNRVQRIMGLESPRHWAPVWSLGLTTAAVMIAGGLLIASASQAVVGDEPADAAPAAEEDGDDAAPSEEEVEEPSAADRDDPPRDRPRDGERGEGDRPRERGADRPRGEGPPRGEGDRPRGDGPPPPPRRGDFGPPREGPPDLPRGDGPPRGRGEFGPRDGERRGPPEAGPRDGERGAGPREGFDDRRGPPMGPDVMRELMEQIRALRAEVADLRNEVRALRGGRGPEGEFRGPPRGREGDGRGPREGDLGPRGERGGPPDGERRGPPRESERGPDGRREKPPGDRPDGPPRGEEERPRRPEAEAPSKKDA